MFFYRTTLYVSAVFAVARCLSVCLSATLVDCIHMAEDIVKLLSPSGSPITLVFWPPAPISNSKGLVGAQWGRNQLQWGANTRGCENLRFSTEIVVYLGNGTKQAQCCYGMLIGSHRRRIDPCRFRWPWVIPTPGIKVAV